MGEKERERARRSKTGPARSRVQSAAETAARAGRSLASAGAGERAKPAARRPLSPEAEIRALRRTLSEADARLRAAEVRFARAQARLVARHERENEALEAQLTKLVQEIGAAKHIVDRAQMREAELRVAEARIAELSAREAAWQEERAALVAEVARLAPFAPPAVGQADAPRAGAKARAAAAAGGTAAVAGGGTAPGGAEQAE
jgi:hypothetical protein